MRLAMLILGACATDPRVSLVVSYEQPDVPREISLDVERGALAWQEYGVVLASGIVDEPCAPDWWNGPRCSLVVSITFEASSTMGGAYGLTDHVTRTTSLAYEATGNLLANDAAHEIGHSLWYTSDHLPAGKLGVMSAVLTGQTELSDSDRAFVVKHTSRE